MNESCELPEDFKEGENNWVPYSGTSKNYWTYLGENSSFYKKGDVR
jgi:hypothetical protein